MVDECKRLLDSGADVNYCLRPSWSLSHSATVPGHILVVQLLLERGVALNTDTIHDLYDQASALQWAAGRAGTGSISVIRGIFKYSLTTSGWERDRQFVNRNSRPFG